MTKIATSLLAGTAFFGLAVVAQAADMGSPLRGPSVIPSMSESSSSTGWYLRGDIGATLETKPDFTHTDDGVTLSGVAMDSSRDRLSSGGKIGLGIGYQFNDYLRGDITGEYYTPRHLRALSTYTGGGTAATSTANTNYFSGDVSAFVVLANAYVDMGKYAGFTPYVGAGVGVANINLSDVSEASSWTAIGASATSGAAVGILQGENKWNFAWALHGGFSYDLTQNLKLDAGYSYKDLGSIKTSGIIACTNGSSPSCASEAGKLKHLALHDFHLGARWTLDPVAAKTPVYAAPVVAKY